MMDTTLATVTVGTDWRAEFESYLGDRDGSVHTIRNYLSDIKTYASWYAQANGEEFRPAYLTNTDLRAYRKWCDEQGISAATWNRRRASLRVLWGWSKEQGYITHHTDIFTGVRSRSIDQQPVKWLDEASFRKLERWLENERSRAMTEYEQWQGARNMAAFRLMSYAGLREAEVCALRLGDVVISDRSGAVTVKHGKGDKQRRVVLVERIRAAITDWLVVRGEQSDDHLFFNKEGQVLGVNAVQEMVAKASQACGLEHVTPHMLRHTALRNAMVRFIQKGHGQQALSMVKEIAGHERLETTMRYVTPSDDELLEALED
jgi:integrase/recombinase XerD